MREILLSALLGYALGKKPGKDAAPNKETSNSGEIEVGAVGSELRYWKAKEALRQGERTLTLEATTMASTLAQATTLLGWIITGITGAAVVAISPQSEWRSSATTIVFGLLIPAIMCIIVVFPRRDTRIEGFDPPQVMINYFESELQQVESMATGLGLAIVANRRKIFIFKAILSASWVLFVAIPVVTFCIMDYQSIKALVGAGAAVPAVLS